MFRYFHVVLFTLHCIWGRASKKSDSKLWAKWPEHFHTTCRNVFTWSHWRLWTLGVVTILPWKFTATFLWINVTYLTLVIRKIWAFFWYQNLNFHGEKWGVIFFNWLSTFNIQYLCCFCKLLWLGQCNFWNVYIYIHCVNNRTSRALNTT